MDSFSSFRGSTHNTVHAENIAFSAMFNISVVPPAETNSIYRIIGEALHSHSYVELFVCCESGITIQLSDANIRLNPGELLLIPPGVTHTKLSSHSKWASIGFFYSKTNNPKYHDFFKKISCLCAGSSPKIIPLSPSVSAELNTMLFETGAEEDNIFRVFHILDILIRISKSFEANSQTGKNFNKNKENDITRLSVLERVVTQFSENLTVSEAARLLHVSERQFNRIVMNHFGMSYHEAVTEYRIKIACLLLCNTDLSADEISRTVGFNNKTTFYVAFRKKHGMTPAEYRKKQL